MNGFVLDTKALSEWLFTYLTSVILSAETDEINPDPWTADFGSRQILAFI